MAPCGLCKPPRAHVSYCAGPTRWAESAELAKPAEQNHAVHPREFGVRMALGARAKDVVQLVAGQSMRLVAFGAVIGLAASLAGAGVLRNMLFGVRAVDPLAYGGVGILLAVVALLACYIPARSATRVDP